MLVPGGVLCVAVVHPLNSAGTFRSREAGSEYVVEESYLRGRRYADSIERAGLRMTFDSLHHPLEDYTRAFEGNGLLVEALREPAVPDEAVRDDADRRWQRVRLFLHLRARLGAG